MPTDDAVGPDQHRAVEMDAVAVDLRHADNDVAIMPARERGETVRGRPRNRLDERRDLGPIEPAVTRGAHLRGDDKPGASQRRGLAEFDQPRDVALLLEHGRLELDGGDLVHARHHGLALQTKNDFLIEAPIVYFGSTMLPSRTRPACVSSM